MRLAFFAALSLSAVTASAAGATCTAPAQKMACDQIVQSVEIFRTAIIKKDRAAFLPLFFSETIPWIGVVTDNSLKQAIAKKTDKSKPDPKKIFSSSNPVDFIDRIVSDKEAVEETFENVRIDTDGDIAQVYFDYSFNYDGYRANWGKESWHMVRTPAGWKINSVIWTMEFNPEPPPKR